MDDLRKKILQPQLKTVKLTNPHILVGAFGNDGDAPTVRIVIHEDVPYKVISESNGVCICQELTKQELADLR